MSTNCYGNVVAHSDSTFGHFDNIRPCALKFQGFFKLLLIEMLLCQWQDTGFLFEEGEPKHVVRFGGQTYEFHVSF